MEMFFKSKVYNSNEDSMDTENEHRTDRNDGNETIFDAIKASA
jgi:ribosomal protein S24E